MMQDEIMKLQTYKMFEGDDTVYVERDDVLEVLKQEPCEDCISRQAVLDCLTATGLKKFDFILDARDKIKNLLPVTPNPKMGKWKQHFHGFPPEPAMVCSECGFDRDFYLRYEDGFDKIRYCPNCGAKMESEE